MKLSATHLHSAAARAFWGVCFIKTVHCNLLSKCNMRRAILPLAVAILTGSNLAQGIGCCWRLIGECEPWPCTVCAANQCNRLTHLK